MSEATDTHNTSIREEFAHQADSFARSPTIDRLLGEAPPAAASFIVRGDPGERTLNLRNSLHRWRVPS